MHQRIVDLRLVVIPGAGRTATVGEPEKERCLMDNKTFTAYHEAGHAVAAYRLGVDGFDISVVVKDDALGHVLCEDFHCTVYNAGANEYAHDIIILFAGYAAEKQLCPNATPDGSCSDDEKARHLLSIVNESEEELRGQAAELIRDNWLSVEAVASTLMRYKQLSWEELETIIDAGDDGDDWEAAFQRLREAMRQFKNEGGCGMRKIIDPNGNYNCR